MYLPSGSMPGCKYIRVIARATALRAAHGAFGMTYTIDRKNPPAQGPSGIWARSHTHGEHGTFGTFAVRAGMFGETGTFASAIGKVR